MKKRILNILSLIAITGGVLTSCDTLREADQDVAGIGTPDYPTATFTVDQTTYNEEGSPEVVVSITLDKPISTDLHFNITTTDGTAVAGEDFEVTDDGTVSAYQTTGTAVITILEDGEGEDTENFSFSIAALDIPYTYEVNAEPTTFDISIENYVANELQFMFDYDTEFYFGTTPYTLCGIGYDPDFYVVDENITSLFDMGAATGACPEEGVVDLTAYPDGTYHIIEAIYDDGGLQSAGVTPSFDILTNVSYTRPGSLTLDGSYTQDAANAPDSSTGYDATYQNTGSVSSFFYVMSFNVTAGVVTMSDTTTNTTFESGKLANMANLLSSKADNLQGVIRK